MTTRRRSLPIVLATLCLLAARADGADEKMTKGDALALLPAAAGVPWDRYFQLMISGGRYSEADLLAGGSTPLTIALLGYRMTQETGDETRDAAEAAEFRSLLGSALTFADASYVVMPERDPEKRSKRGFASLLIPENIKEVTCESAEREAHGTVTLKSADEFEGQPVLEGRFSWKARKGPEGWKIVELGLPVRRFHLTLVDGGWKVVNDEPRGAPLHIRTAAMFASPTAVLPVVDAAKWLDPVRREFTLALAADGRVLGSEHEFRRDDDLTFDLRSWTRATDESPREKDGAFAGDVMVRAAAGLPWECVAWMLAILSRPKIEIYRVYFAVRVEGGVEEGAVPSFLPKDAAGEASGGAAGAQRETVRIQLKPHAKGVMPAAATAAFKAMLAKTPSPRVVLDVETGVAAGHAIRTVAWLRAAGAKEVYFAAPREAMPEAHGYRGPLTAYVQEHPARRPGFSMVVGGTTLTGE